MTNHDWIHISKYDDGRGIEVNWKVNADIPTLLGSMEIAKQMLLDGVINTNPFMQHIQHAKHTKSQARLKKYNKDEAMKKYIEVGQKIQQRLQAIQKSDEIAQFEIDDDLLQKL